MARNLIIQNNHSFHSFEDILMLVFAIICKTVTNVTCSMIFVDHKGRYVIFMNMSPTDSISSVNQFQAL